MNLKLKKILFFIFLLSICSFLNQQNAEAKKEEGPFLFTYSYDFLPEDKEEDFLTEKEVAAFMDELYYYKEVILSAKVRITIHEPSRFEDPAYKKRYSALITVSTVSNQKLIIHVATNPKKIFISTAKAAIHTHVKRFYTMLYDIPQQNVDFEQMLAP